jgi:hypothetical protein
MAGEVIHRRRNFDGRETAEQVHAELAWYGEKCGFCGAPPALKVNVFLLLSDMTTESREAVMFEIGMGRVSPIRGPRGWAVRWATKVACRSCAPALERAVARKAPSWACVEIDRGPGADSPIVGVVAAVP